MRHRRGGDMVQPRLQFALSFIGASGIVLIFLPFAYDVVPLTDVLIPAVMEPITLLALPAIVLPIPIAIGYALWLWGRLPRWGSAAGWTLWSLGLACSLGAVILGGDEPLDSPLLVLTISGYAGGAWFGRVAGGANGPPGGLLGMQSAYLVNMGSFLGGFYSEGDVGLYLAGAAAIAYLLQLALAIRPRWAWLALAWLPPLAMAISSALYPL